MCEMEAAANQNRVSRLRVPEHWPHEVWEEFARKQGPAERGGSKGPRVPVWNWHRQTRREMPESRHPRPR